MCSFMNAATRRSRSFTLSECSKTISYFPAHDSLRPHVPGAIMSNLVHYDISQRVAVLTIDNPPVNALGPGVWEAVDEAGARASADSDVDAVVLIGAGQTFVAGADINIFKTLRTREQSLERSGRTHALLARLEDAPKPLIAAIHGNALGGGLELAMACH